METSFNFTPKVQQLIQKSKEFALSLNDSVVTPDHLLLIILESEDISISNFLNSFGFSFQKVKNFSLSFSNIEKKDYKIDACKYGDDFNKLLVDSRDFASEINHSYICIEHIFFSLLNIKDGTLYSFFFAHNISPHKVAQAFILLVKAQEKLLLQKEIIPGIHALSPHPDIGAIPESMLESFCVNFNELCSQGKIGKIIGKSKEIDRVSEILCRKNKNNPLLLGDPGVGKTAIVEGLANSINDNTCSPLLSSKIIYGVDLSSMIAGTKYRGQFEQRINSLIKECKKNTDIILFIDEIHTIVGAGSAEGALDAANILKPSLARGEIKLIGATTFSEYKKNIEKDIALTRRFESIQVEEPSKEETFNILKGVKESYEKFHGIKYNLNILKQIINLCDTYLPSKKFPDKAIDVLDDVGTKVKMRNLCPPPEMNSIESKIFKMIDSDIVDSEKENALIKEYDSIMKDWESRPFEKVCYDDILNVISQKSKIPKNSLVKEKDKKSSILYKSLSKEVINQDKAISAISRSILRSKIGLKNDFKPIGSFLFLGASGVGKTWCAKMLAKHYFGSAKNVFRLDMSEYSEKVSASKLIGASPGYVGYEEGGVLIEHMKKKPHCVILFDEIEKSDPGVQQLLLQVLEEGELEDNLGTKVFFKDSIIILTSNVGSNLASKSNLGFGQTETSMEDKIFDAAKNAFSPELINRLDEIVCFNHLSQSDLKEILLKETRLLQKKLKNKNISFSLDEEVVNFISLKASEEKLGARPLKRLLQKNIEDQIVDFYFRKQEDSPKNFSFYLKEGCVSYKIVE